MDVPWMLFETYKCVRNKKTRVEKTGGILMEITKIEWDPSVYPRSKWNEATVERYADAMKAGDTFPPMVIEKETNRLLDGKHRMLAYKKAGITDVPVDEHQVPEDVPVKLYAASLSARHGDRMSNADLKDVVRESWASLDGEKAPGKMVAKMLGISEGTVSGFVSDLLAKQREERRSKALRLSLLGWTQAEIAERLGVTQPKINQDIKNFDSELFYSGHTDDEIALRLGLPIQVVKAIQLKNKTDDDRVKTLNIKIRPYDVWSFQKCHDLMGDQHPGRIPGDLIVHVMYFFTQPGDLVVDPMAGSGTTLDAALLMGRKARGYDIDTHHERIDVEQHDLSAGWPDTVSKAKLIFWDPPYFDKKDSEYIKGSISGLDPDDYRRWLSDRFSELYAKVKDKTVLTFLMSDWDSENAKHHANHTGIFIWDYAADLKNVGWKVIRQIQAPLPTQQVHPDIINKFRSSKRLARLGRYLLVAIK
jgi:predicted transcriptional regulator